MNLPPMSFSISNQVEQQAQEFCAQYLDLCQALMQRILREESGSLMEASRRLAEQVAADRLVHIFGPGGHSNLAAQELFYRSGGLMHISPILDEGTMLLNGALRSSAMERLPGYGATVIANWQLGAQDILILVNTFGINAAVIDAALEARRHGVFVIGINSHAHAESTPADHPARHPSQKNLHDIVNTAIDNKVPSGDAALAVPGVSEKIASLSTFANASILNCLLIQTVTLLAAQGIEPAIWRSRNSPGGDEANAQRLRQFVGRVRCL